MSIVLRPSEPARTRGTSGFAAGKPASFGSCSADPEIRQRLSIRQVPTVMVTHSDAADASKFFAADFATQHCFCMSSRPPAAQAIRLFSWQKRLQCDGSATTLLCGTRVNRSQPVLRTLRSLAASSRPRLRLCGATRPTAFRLIVARELATVLLCLRMQLLSALFQLKLATSGTFRSTSDCRG